MSDPQTFLTLAGALFIVNATIDLVAPLFAGREAMRIVITSLIICSIVMLAIAMLPAGFREPDTVELIAAATTGLLAWMAVRRFIPRKYR